LAYLPAVLHVASELTDSKAESSGSSTSGSRKRTGTSEKSPSTDRPAGADDGHGKASVS